MKLVPVDYFYWDDECVLCGVGGIVQWDDFVLHLSSYHYYTRIAGLPFTMGIKERVPRIRPLTLRA